MRTTKSYKTGIATLLVLVFFSPALIKAAHILYAEHQHELVLNSNTVKINESHNDCPICKFEFTQLIASESYSEKTHHILVSDSAPLLNKNIIKSSALLSFHLRAPPVISFL
ncbi:MAG: hypothetical protein GQ540_02985 [Lutibacter sp.]|uniref:hypothetical protein n=1 Tax=Lutibacter sp. TaxID=1925666 RepID=UPI001A0C6D1E|nr:hypothetical protein [Lutibacter sp.]NOR27475.1 hypothetical protein [Lutibacter sp.]